MAEYIPSPRDWVREQVELYERTNGAEGNTLRDTGLPVIIVTHIGNKTGAIRKTPLMRVKDGENYVLVGSMGGAPNNPVWIYNLRTYPQIELRDLSVVQTMRVREVTDAAERERLWKGCRRGLSAVRGISDPDHSADSDLRRGAGEVSAFI